MPRAVEAACIHFTMAFQSCLLCGLVFRALELAELTNSKCLLRQRGLPSRWQSLLPTGFDTNCNQHELHQLHQLDLESKVVMYPVAACAQSPN